MIVIPVKPTLDKSADTIKIFAGCLDVVNRCLEYRVDTYNAAGRIIDTDDIMLDGTTLEKWFKNGATTNDLVMFTLTKLNLESASTEFVSSTLTKTTKKGIN